MLALLAVATAGVAAGQEPRPPVFGEKVELVSVDALVLDGGGNPVRGLTRQDFAVEEDGVAQAIASFEAIGFEESEPSETEGERFVSSNTLRAVRPEQAFLVVYDDVHLTPFGARLAQDELEKLLDALAPGDVVTVLVTSSKASWTARLPEGRPELETWTRAVEGRKHLDRTAGRISDWEALQIHYGRDPDVLGMVARRYFENGLIAELPPPGFERDSRAGLELAYGLPQIRAKAAEVYDEATRGAVAALEAMKRAVAALGTERGRKAVLVLSEGFFHDSTRTELRELVEAARDANAVVYFFDARGRSGPSAPDSQAENWRLLEERDRARTATNFARDAEGAESVAYDTGGRVFEGTDDLASAMTRVVRESRSYYMLGYVSTNPTRDGKFRRIEVKVARPGLEVRARKGYHAARAGGETSPRPASAMDPQVRAGLDSPFDSVGIPMRLASYVLGRGPTGSATVVLAADLDLRSVAFQAEGDRRTAALETFALVSPLAGGGGRFVEKRVDLSLPPDVHARVLEAGLPILRDFELPSGRYQARLLVRDARGGAVGTVRHGFEVPPAEGFRISTPILSDNLVRGEGGGEVPVPLARRSFASGSRVVYAFDVYGAAPDAAGARRVAIGYTVRGKGGAVLAASPARAAAAGPDGSLSHRMVLSLSGAAPGEYELLLTVEDVASGARLERRDRFVVGPS